MKTRIAGVIRVAREKGRKIGISGQAPGDDPDFARSLVEQGTGSISLNPEAVLRTTLGVLELEAATADACRGPTPRSSKDSALRGHDLPATRLAFSPEVGILAASGNDGDARFRDLGEAGIKRAR